MSHRIAPLLLTFVAGFCASPFSSAAEPKPAERLSLSELSLEVIALRTLHEFQMTSAQMAAMSKLAIDNAAEAAPREEGEGSAKLRQVLTDLRAALIRGDDRRIAPLEDKLGDLLDEDETELDDGVKITPTARAAAGQLYQLLSRTQLVDYLQNNRDEMSDPLASLLGALRQADKLDDDEWNDLAEEVKDELSWQLGGLDLTRSRLVGERVESFLKTVRALNEADLKKQRPDLENAARQFVGQVPAVVVQVNTVHHELAELLANPRLAAALAARMKR